MSKAYKVNKYVFFSSPIYINDEKPKTLISPLHSNARFTHAYIIDSFFRVEFLEELEHWISSFIIESETPIFRLISNQSQASQSEFWSSNLWISAARATNGFRHFGELVQKND